MHYFSSKIAVMDDHTHKLSRSSLFLALSLSALGFLVAALLITGLGYAPLSAHAQPEQSGKTQSESPEQALRAALQGSLGAEVVSITPSAMPGFYDAQLAEGNVLVDAQGRYFITGDLYEIRSSGAINHTEVRRSQWRKVQLAAVKKRDLLIFSPKTEAKTYVNIFTDVDCGYCRRLHQDVPVLNNRYGIEVRYLAFPRAGVGSPTYNKMVTAWCANDGRRKLTRLKNGDELPVKLCIDNPVSRQYELGKSIGVRGTPAIFTPSGELLPGYLPPEELAKRLGVR
jgi:thiol:disulfide interchange protein DsbC